MDWQDNVEIWRRDCIGFLDQLFDANIEEMNGKILICIFWRMLGAFISVAPTDLFSVGDYIFLMSIVFLRSCGVYISEQINLLVASDGYNKSFPGSMKVYNGLASFGRYLSYLQNQIGDRCSGSISITSSQIARFVQPLFCLNFSQKKVLFVPFHYFLRLFIHNVDVAFSSFCHLVDVLYIYNVDGDFS